MDKIVIPPAIEPIRCVEISNRNIATRPELLMIGDDIILYSERILNLPRL